MIKINFSNFFSNLLFVVIGVYFSSCITSKELKYFQNVPDSTKLHSIKLSNYVVPVIHPEDILSISIAIVTPDGKVTSINSANTASSSGASSSSNPGSDPIGDMVDSLGYIHLAVLGAIKVSDLTIAQATNAITKTANLYYVDPVVVVKNKSFKVTILGEISKPGTFYITATNASVIDLIGLGGDLTTFAKRNTIHLYRRNSDNTLSTYIVDLTNSNTFQSPVYYLQSNDLVIVDPNKSKAISSDAIFSRNLTLFSLVLSSLTTILILFRN